MTSKQVDKLQKLLNKSLLALRDAEQLAQEDWLLCKKIELAKDAVHVAMATSDLTYAITNS